MFADGVSAPQVAAELEISTKSAYAWRRAWKAGGEQALAFTAGRVLGRDFVAGRTRLAALD